MTTLNELTAAARELPEPALREVLDFALFLRQRAPVCASDDAERRSRLAAALERAAELDPFKGVDPVQWQREQRQDRALPGREA